MRVYPFPGRNLFAIERAVSSLGKSVGLCPVCEKLTIFFAWSTVFRETGLCIRCGSTNRQRQIAHVVSDSYKNNSRYNGFNDNELVIYNLESNGPVHRQLSNSPNYFCSEYLGPQYKPGEVINGVMHQDVHHLSFENERFDLVISADVWEHLHSPYAAHKEIWRVLKPGGRHVFTVPFDLTSTLEQKRAIINDAGEIEHYFDPLYHFDPVNPKGEGVLVFNIFSLSSLPKLEEIGYKPILHKVYSPIHGIFGNNGIVLEAIKP